MKPMMRRFREEVAERRKQRWKCALLAAIQTSLLFAAAPRADIALDHTLGNSGQPILPDDNDVYHLSDDLGQYSGDGSNLFHSFSRFNIDLGETATFSSTLHIPENVIARVTGEIAEENRSIIKGTLRSTIPGANLFLLNPSGITVSRGAVLDVPGSVHLTTADTLRLEEQWDYDRLADPRDAPLLSAAAPSAFGFTQSDPRNIGISGLGATGTAPWSVPEGERLSIVGADDGNFGVSMLGNASGTKNIDVGSGTLQIASAGSAVDIPIQLEDLDVDALEPGQLGDVFVEGSAWLEASSSPDGGASGSILIRAESFVLSSAVLQTVHTASDEPTAGSIDVQAKRDIEILNSAGIRTLTTQGQRGGDVLLRGESVSIGSDAILNSWVQGGGPEGGDSSRIGGHIHIEGRDSVTIDGAAQVRSQGPRTASPATFGGLGDLVIEADSVAIRGNGTQLLSRPRSAGVGGDIDISARTIEVSDRALITSLSTGATSPPEGAELKHGGDIRFGAEDMPAESLRVTDRALVESIHDGPAGTRGGDVHVWAENVAVEQHGQIVAKTVSAGGAGDLMIDADWISIRHGEFEGLAGIAIDATAEATGSGGLLRIDTRILEIEDRGFVKADTFGLGDAGNVEIIASERVSVRGGEHGVSEISAGSLSVDRQLAGSGGSISVDAPLVELQNGGHITTSSQGAGNAGELEINADRIEISGIHVNSSGGESRPGLFSKSTTTALDPLPEEMEGMEGTEQEILRAEGGTITVTVSGDLALSDGAHISAETSGPGNAGNIDIHAGGDISLTSADISALSRGLSEGSGVAGRVDVTAGERLELRDSTITTQAEASTGGKLTVEAQELVYLVDSEIATKVKEGTGDGGEINIDPDFVVLDGASIISDAGRAGNILISGDHLFLSADSILSASSRIDVDGEIVAEPPETEVIGQLTALETSLVDAASLLTTPCAARTAPAGSFVVSSRNPLSASPDSPLSWIDVAGLDGLVPAGPECPVQATP
jgi:filamentous hemagglutinin family protein